jgi:hypothetical protein
MKASELRIGNLLEFSNGIQPTKTVTVGRRFFSSASIETEDGDFEITCYYKPIPLTEEWLEKFGFEKYTFDMSVAPQYRWKNRLIVVRDGCFVDYALSVQLKYVHKLQNLYFELGEELTTKN